MRRARAIVFTLALVAAGGLPGCSSSGEDAPPATPAPEVASAGTTETSAPATPPTRTDQGRNVEERIEDASTAARVKMALTEERALRSFDFEPGVTEGRVTLSGNVATRAQGRRAADIADEVDGVDEVVNRLTVDGQQVAWSQPEEEDGGDQQVADAASSGNAPGPSDGTSGTRAYHTVETGESLWAIANEYGTSVARVRSLNNMRSNSLQPGQRLLVRQGSGGAPGSNSGDSSPAVAEANSSSGSGDAQTNGGGDDASTENTPESSPAAGESASEEAAEKYHVVERGESLWAIASQNNITVTRLRELNDLTSDNLMPGDRLRVE